MKEVLKHNSRQFVLDFKRVSDIMVFTSGGYLNILKRQLWELAKEREIDYRIDDGIFVMTKDAMVIH